MTVKGGMEVAYVSSSVLSSAVQEIAHSLVIISDNTVSGRNLYSPKKSTIHGKRECNFGSNLKGGH
jgi:hypothetical protein